MIHSDLLLVFILNVKRTDSNFVLEPSRSSRDQISESTQNLFLTKELQDSFHDGLARLVALKGLEVG
jgi:hypothetical protein